MQQHTIPTLETPRLRLRPFRVDDFPAFAAMWADPDVVRFITGVPMTREAAWTRFLRHAGIWQLLGFGFFAIEEKATGAYLGEAGFHDLHRDLTPSLEGTLETGWGLVKAAHGKGLAEEAVRAVLDWGATFRPGGRATCMIAHDHAASIRVAQKLGFREFARTPYHGSPVVLFERTLQDTGTSAASASADR